MNQKTSDLFAAEIESVMSAEGVSEQKVISALRNYDVGSEESMLDIMTQCGLSTDGLNKDRLNAVPFGFWEPDPAILDGNREPKPENLASMVYELVVENEGVSRTQVLDVRQCRAD